MALILVTGRPGCGKTTLVRRALEALDSPAGGFYTRELRAGGRRTGFEIVTLDGRATTLASVDVEGPHRVGRYGVDVEALERVGVPAVEAAVERGGLVVIDEIGKMELRSGRFQRAVLEAVRRHRLLLATVMLAPHPFADELKRQSDAMVFELTEVDRERIYGLVEAQLRAGLGRLSV